MLVDHVCDVMDDDNWYVDVLSTPFTTLNILTKLRFTSVHLLFIVVNYTRELNEVCEYPLSCLKAFFQKINAFSIS